MAIAPADPERFLAEFWERQPLHVPRGEPGRFDALLSAADAERLVCEPGLRYPALRLVKAGARLDARGYTTDLPWQPAPFSGTARVDRLLAEFQRGATIVLQGLHLNRTATATFCRLLEEALGHPVQANAYLTPAGSQGLPVHHDTHDVFVLQVDGTKRWLVYEPVLDLPLRHQRYRPELGAPDKAVLELELGPGDTLYLPRGWLHEALTSVSDSLHLTVGVNVVTWLDVFRAALDTCGDAVEFRRSPSGDVDALLDGLRERVEATSAADVTRRRAERRLPLLDGQLSQLRALGRLEVDTLLERRPAVSPTLSIADGRVRLAVPGKRIWLPDVARDELEAIVAAQAPFRMADLPGRLDDAGRRVLARRLVREGVLRAVDLRD